MKIVMCIRNGTPHTQNLNYLSHFAVGHLKSPFFIINSEFTKNAIWGNLLYVFAVVPGGDGPAQPSLCCY